MFRADGDRRVEHGHARRYDFDHDEDAVHEISSLSSA